MTTSVLHIKNMVCDRCIRVVRNELENLGLSIKSISLGKIELQTPQEIDANVLRSTLEKEGFELIETESVKIINTIKTLVIQQIHKSPSGKSEVTFSEYLESELHKDYSSLSTLFSKAEGRTIEKYMIQQRVERIKELLIYGEKTVNEIAWELNYSSAQYLSNQFKAETGLTPTQFRKLISNRRKPLDKV